MSVVTNLFANKSELEQTLAKKIADRLQSDIKEFGQASLAVSGGSTPKALFLALSVTAIDWSKVVVTLIDERWVDETHTDSNARLVKENLLINLAAKAQFLSLKNTESDPFRAMPSLEKQLNTSLTGAISVSVLGMGGDSHTASFFPGAEHLAIAIDLENTNACQGMLPLTAPHARMTLTLSRILNSQDVYVHITGADKKTIFEQAQASVDFNQSPISAVLQQQHKDVNLYWAP